jgi:hypothetical protein
LGSEPLSLSEEEEKEFYRLHKLYWREARRCEKAEAYLAGCVMLGAALEGLLIIMVNCYPDEAEATGQAPMKKGQLKPLLEWSLADLLRIAKAADWLPSSLNLNDDWSSRKARIGDYAEVVRMVRNLIHPARFCHEHYRQRVTLKYFRRLLEVLELCRDWLLHYNNNALLEQLKAEDSDAVLPK